MPNAVLQRLVDEREQINRDIDHVNEQSADDERDPSESERQLLARYRQRLVEVEPMIVEQLDLEEQRHVSRDASAVLQRGGARGGTAVERAPATISRVSEPLPWQTPGQFIVDHLRAAGGMREGNGSVTVPDPGSIERMQNYIQRALENQTTADTPGILPTPIVGTVIAQKTAVQPFLSSIGGAKPMGGIPGKTFSRPKITQHTLVGLQAGEKTELPSRKMVIGSVPFTKVTKGGSVDVSRQDIDWTVPSAWDILLGDLAAVYGEEVENEVADDMVTKIAAPAIPVAAATLEALAAALYAAAAEIFTATTPHRLPNRLWMSVDVWAKYGPLIDVAIITAGAQAAALLTSQGASGFSGNMFGVPRIIVPSFPASTMVLGVAEAYEVYEEVVGVLSAVEPALFGVQVAYGGYVAFNAVEPEGLRKFSPLTGLMSEDEPETP